MLLGAHPGDTFDTNMEVTVAYNHFGPGLTQRLPRSADCQSYDIIAQRFLKHS